MRLNEFKITFLVFKAPLFRTPYRMNPPQFFMPQAGSFSIIFVSIAGYIVVVLSGPYD